MTRFASAKWLGDGLTGTGSLTTQTGVFKNQVYGFKMRFGDEAGKTGTNPEELLAAAHAGCFSMALSFGLSGAGFKVEEISTTAKVEVEPQGGGFGITKIHLDLQAKVPGITQQKFQDLAAEAKAGCPVSRALASVPITLNAVLL
jgi:osmotically inducible protein OsmC